MNKKQKQVAYQLKDRIFVEPFRVYFSHNAWWMDSGKVLALVYGFKRGYSIQEASCFAGISLDQYKYFCKVHPEFSSVKARCKGLLPILVKEELVRDIETDPQARRWYLERTQPEIYGRPGVQRRSNSKKENETIDGMSATDEGFGLFS